MATLIKPITFPSIRPPEDQTGFESNVGYEWASRLTLFVQQLTATLDNVINNPASPPGFLMTEDEGLVVNLNCNEMNFVGAGVTATVGGPNKTIVTIPGGGGGGGFLKGDEFTASGTWTCPANVTGAWITMIGGGGSGSATIIVGLGGGGGASGEQVTFLPVKVTPGNAYTVTIGAGGAALAAGLGVATAGNPGGATSFNTFPCLGGAGGTTLGVGGLGGGTRSGTGGLAGNPGATGLVGTASTPNHFGGSGGSGGGNTFNSNGGVGSGAGGYLTGAAGGTAVPATTAGGGAGATTIYGLGGVGGNGGATGGDAPAASYGSGGGGAGAKATTTAASGKGAPGYVLVQYVA